MNIQSVNNSPGGAASLSPPTRQNAPDIATTMPDVQQARSAAVAQAQQQAQAQAAQPSTEQVHEAVKAVSSIVESVNSSLQFSVDNDSGKTVVKVVDSSTNKVIRQIPSEEMMAIAKALDGIKGLLVRQKA